MVVKRKREPRHSVEMVRAEQPHPLSDYAYFAAMFDLLDEASAPSAARIISDTLEAAERSQAEDRLRAAGVDVSSAPVREYLEQAPLSAACWALRERYLSGLSAPPIPGHLMARIAAKHIYGATEGARVLSRGIPAGGGRLKRDHLNRADTAFLKHPFCRYDRNSVIDKTFEAFVYFKVFAEIRRVASEDPSLRHLRGDRLAQEIDRQRGVDAVFGEVIAGSPDFSRLMHAALDERISRRLGALNWPLIAGHNVRALRAVEARTDAGAPSPAHVA